MADYIEFRLPNKIPYYDGVKTLDGNQYRIKVRWNSTTEKWYIDITSVSDPTISIKGKALLPGKDLLGPHGYGNILGQIWVEDTAGTTDNPDYEGLGYRWRLRYYPLES